VAAGGVTLRPEVRERFRRVLARGIERADREHREHLAKIRALPKLPPEDRDGIGEMRRQPKRSRP